MLDTSSRIILLSQYTREGSIHSENVQILGPIALRMLHMRYLTDLTVAEEISDEKASGWRKILVTIG